MSHFDDAVMPTGVRLGSTGKLITSSQKNYTRPGYRKINQLWEQKLRRLSLQFRKGDATFYQLREIAEAMEGPTHSFLCRDWTDWNSGRRMDNDGLAYIAATDQPLKNTVTGLYVGDGSTKTFQMYKKYIKGATAAHYRKIQKPQSTTLRGAVGGTGKTEGVDFTVAYATGIWTFTAAPGNGVAATWGGAFYTPVAFVDDNVLEQVIGAGGSFDGTLELEEVRLSALGL